MAALPPRYRLLLWLQYATGARIGEIAYLEWADVDLAAGTLALGRHLGARKTGERVVCLADEVLEELRAWRDRPPETPARGSPPSAEVGPPAPAWTASPRTRSAGGPWTRLGARGWSWRPRRRSSAIRPPR